jgi:zinc transport system substrate-binding protein
MQYLVSRIGKEHISVGIVPGVTSHQSSVDWSPKEIIAMTEADYLFYVGANYDGYIDKQIGTIFQNKNVELVKIETAKDSEGKNYITFIEGVHHAHDHHDDDDDDHEADGISIGLDPHFWISPERMKQVAKLVFDKLVSKNPDVIDELETNYLELLADLQLLSNRFDEVIKSQTKPIMTATNIYGYLKHDYDLQYISISPGFHEETEYFTNQEKEALIAEALFHNIKHILYEKNSSSPLSNAVFESLSLLNVNPVKLEYHILQTLYRSDSLADKDFLSIMYENLNLIKIATNYQE